MKSSRRVKHKSLPERRQPRPLTARRGRRAATVALLILIAFCASLSRQQLAWAQDAAAAPGPGATLFAGNVNSAAFPTVAINVYGVDGDGLPITRLVADDLFVAEDGVELSAEALQIAPDTEAPLNLVIALNRAAAPADWAAVIASVDDMLDQMSPSDSVGVIAYNENVETLIAPTQDFGAARAVLAAAQPSGTQSGFYVAVNQGLRLFEDVDGRRALVVVTDRGNTTPEGGPTVLPALIAAARQLSVAVHIAGFGPAGTDPEFLQLAQGTGGRAVAVSSAADVAPLLASLPPLLRQGFRVAYQSKLPATDDDHLLSLALRDLGAGQTLMRGFNASRRPLDVRITQPADGQRVSGATVITFDAVAPAPVARVTFSLDTGEIITSTESALGGIIWNSASAPAGERRLKVTVEDNAGNVGEDEVRLEVVSPLYVAVQLGAGEATVGESVVITALVDSALGGATVEAFVGRTQVGVQANRQGAVRFAVDTTAFVPGRYGIFVRATDAQGNLATDDAQVLTVVPPANTNVTPANVWEAISVWFGRYWLWLAGALLGLLLLWVLWLVVRGIIAAIQRGRRAQQTARARLTPQVRMLITNAGNIRTPYRLRAEAKGADLVFTFLLDGVPLQPPVAVRAVTSLPAGAPAVASNGRHAQAAPQPMAQPAAPRTAPTSAENVAAAKASAQNAASIYKGASKVADTGGRLLTSLGRLIPGSAGAQFRRAGSAVVGQQTSVRRAQGQILDTVGDVDDVGYYGKSMAPAGAAAGVGGAATTVASPYAAQQSYAPAPSAPPAPPPTRPATINPAFELKGEAGSSARGAATRVNGGSQWVETPAISPGETVGIDIYVAALEKSRRNDVVTFNVISGPAAGAAADTITDAVSVRLQRTR